MTHTGPHALPRTSPAAAPRPSEDPEWRTAAEEAVAVLAAAGVRRCYTVPGESFLELADALERHADIQLVSTRHEGGAAFMAEAEAKLTGVPAVAAATRGPGAGNLAVGVHTARQDSTPMVVFLGQVTTDHLGREAFQEVDLAAFYTPITKWTTTVTRADRLAETTAQALRTATTGRPGPVAVVVPGDLFGRRVPPPAALPGAAPPAPPLGEDERDRLAAWLVGAERPVIVAGGGARSARDELVAVAERFNTGVYTSWRRQDVFPNHHPLYLGHLGLGCPAPVLAALESADAVLVVGSRLSEITSQSYRLPAAGPGAAATVAQIDIDPHQIGAATGVWLGAVADARRALAALVEVPAVPPDRDYTAAHDAWVRASTPPPEAAAHAGAGLHPWAVVEAMRAALPEDTVVTNDAGNFAAFLHRGWWYRHPRTQLAPTSGAMGYAVPAAVAAKLAAPHRTVVAVAGDGGVLMTGQELETAARLGLAVTVVVFQNGLYGTIAMHQARELGRTAAVDIGGPLDLASYARGLGAAGRTATTPGELADALAEAVAAEGPTLIDVRTDPDIISPEASLSGLLGGA
ncbi:thiamine pyrophosphate-dependent enzyme [Streptomonospora nanhaiensis]|uniref:Acetolactate synthase-1/2/3 large subunit n=1 Tax=Streptomonospora nanhaiensis TaxID=1323731 RepID=A0A853BJZ2_9ACTN|nr:thiamine pyrophosphate-dependent enzyme [Streptomonospora nanhaiensis]MBV2362512.1 thiamine pyrophosphate-binding protein [Streptomonospora nanhaiensis]MBX9389326.1 thiamine pyrophosphate-binding protein [Streptomonospora nanhaiensis]NYI94826.1 acetolactate synthase-1/2/3 large subunit [Streptomonospora nanhaiensis]